VLVFVKFTPLFYGIFLDLKLTSDFKIYRPIEQILSAPNLINLKA
jgi:hypothetical protein